MSILIWLLVIAVCMALGACAVFTQPRFGKLPEGQALKPLEQSLNYRDGKFQYPLPTPLFSQDTNTFSIIVKGIFSKSERLVPKKPIPTVKTNLKGLDPKQDTVIWLGHSSWFIQLAGKRILIDPILSDFAAPFSAFNKAFAGTTIYQPDDIPAIDILLISHDHWDHLDYPTVKALQSKVKQVICPLGLAASFYFWGYPEENVFEGDWNDSVAVSDDLTIHLLPARHYSGRFLGKNKTLWAAFALISSQHKIFFSGDSGYGPHFREIGDSFNGFDLVMLDCGQYDPRWSFIHMTPEEAAKAAEDLKANVFLPAHVGRFTIANHPWDEPFNRLADATKDKSYQAVTPKIGEPVMMDDPSPQFTAWWLEVEQSKVAAVLSVAR